MSPSLELEVSIGPGVAVVRLSGTIDALNSPELRQTLLELVDEAGPSLLVDLTGVLSFESSALGVLVAANRGCRAAGGALALVLAEDAGATLRALRAGLGDVLAIFPSVTEGRAAFGARIAV